VLSKGAESGKRDNIRVKYREEHLDKQQKIGPHSKVTREAKKKKHGINSYICLKCFWKSVYVIIATCIRIGSFQKS